VKAPRKPRILVVDDERQITRVLRMSLETHGYEVALAEDGRAALKVIEAFSPDLIITDLSMPLLDGVELTRAVRTSALTPIIVLSVREQDATKVQALDAGADDYVTKPFSTPELLARVRAQLRRPRLNDSQVTEPQPSSIAEGDFAVDIEAHRVLVRGAEVHLTPKEFDLLLLFTRNSGRVLTHKALLRAIWGPGEHPPDNLRVLIAALRRKIDLPEAQSYVESEPWIGYRFRAQLPSPEPLS
jgi:two-component system KDP operon response regulator KdpE